MAVACCGFGFVKSNREEQGNTTISLTHFAAFCYTSNYKSLGVASAWCFYVYCVCERPHHADPNPARLKRFRSVKKGEQEFAEVRPFV